MATSTHVFKSVDGLDISVDIHLPTAASASNPVNKVLVWWHGGGLLQGTRKGMSPHMQSAPDKHGIAVVAADYRLAPQTRIPGIIADARDVVAWVQSEAFGEAVQSKATNENVYTSGSSAGGWLSLLVASELSFDKLGVKPLPRPVTGCIAIYPITDITDPFWTTKQRPVSYMEGRIIDGPSELGEYLDPKAPPTASSSLDSPRAQFYHYMIQEAILQELLLTGTDIKAGDMAVGPAVKDGRIKKMPPTIIIHGT